MPELPEVETTKRGLEKTVIGLTIKDVWTDLNTKDKRKKETLADAKYFPIFKKEILGKKIISVERRAKNILINLSTGPSTSLRAGKTILIHMKMTGHLLFNNKDKFVHALFTLSGGNYLAFSDMRKFGKITLLDTKSAHDTKHLKDIGPEPLDKKFTSKILQERLLKKPNGKIKTVLMDQTIISGIGNIYSDEILWDVGINPERKIKDIKNTEFKKIFSVMQKILKKSIALGGDSMSDYINLFGKKGGFQECHKAYRRTGKKCQWSRVSSRGQWSRVSSRDEKSGCKGKIMRKIINGRSAHFCSVHQK